MIIITFIIAYLMIGSVLARRDYALRLTSANSIDHESTLAEKIAVQKGLTHTRGCWRGSLHKSTSHDCDCIHAVTWKRLDRQIAALQAGEIVVRSPYPMLFGWPLLGFHGFLTSGTVKGAPALRPKSWEAKMERELLELDS